MQKGFAPILVLVGILALAMVAGGVYLFSQFQTPKLQPQSQTGEYQVFGTLDKAATAEDQQILQSSVKQLSISFGLLESFPAQLQIVTKDINSCEEVRKVLATFKFVQNFGECKKRQIPQNPNQPVSNEPTPQTTPSDETANWKTYTNKQLKYEFKYPTDWNETQSELNSGVFGIQHSKDGEMWVIVAGYISKAQLSVSGVTYCGAYSEDKARCESKTINGNLRVGIDWGTEVDHKAYAHAAHPNGGIVTFTLEPVIPETKSIFNQILSTFKFTN